MGERWNSEREGSIKRREETGWIWEVVTEQEWRRNWTERLILVPWKGKRTTQVSSPIEG